MKSVLHQISIFIVCSLGLIYLDSPARAGGSYGSAPTPPRTTQNPGEVPFASGTFTDTLQKSAVPNVRVMAHHQAGFSDCDQACLYQKANENLTLQIAYLQQKKVYLETATDDSEIKAVLGAFCGDETVKQCKKRYLEQDKFVILKARTSLGNNFEQVSKLECTRRDAQGKCLGAQAPAVEKGLIDSNPSQTTLYAQSTYISTASEMDQLVAQKKLLGVTDGDDKSMNEWSLEQSKALMPDKDDFVKFKRIAKPGGGSPDDFMVIPETDAMGNKVIDQAAYELALANYKLLFGQKPPGTSGATSADYDYKKIYKNKTLNEKKREAIDHYEKSKTDPRSARGAYAETHDDFAKQLDDHAAKQTADQSKQKGLAAKPLSPGGSATAASNSSSSPSGDRPILPVKSSFSQTGTRVQEDSHYLYLTPDRIQFEPKAGTRPPQQPQRNSLDQVAEPSNDAYTNLDFN